MYKFRLIFHWSLFIRVKFFLQYSSTRRVDGNIDILSHPGLPRGHMVVVFYIRAFYWLPSLSFHDNWASHSRDTIWPWKFKVKGQDQMYPSQCSIQLTHFLSVSHQGILSTPVPFVPWQTGLPFPRYNLTLKIQGQRYPSQRTIQLTHFLNVSPGLHKVGDSED